MADAARLDVPAEAPGVPAGGERPQLGALLRNAGFISERQLDEALDEGTRTGARLGEVVVSRGWASEDDIAKLLAEQWGLGYVERASIWFDAGALKRMSREQAQRLEALPTRVQDGRVVVAVAEPTEQRLAALRDVIGEDTVVVVVPKSALDAGLRSELLSGPAAPETALEPAASLPPLRTTHAQPAEPQPDSPPARPAKAPAERTPAPAAHRAREHEPEPGVAELLSQLQQAARDAASLQLRVGELAGRLDRLAAHLDAVAGRLAQDGAEGERARLDRLEEQLEQRTELTERLKAQLSDLARTLDTLD